MPNHNEGRARKEVSYVSVKRSSGRRAHTCREANGRWCRGLVAMIFYALIAWAIGKLAWLIGGETRSAVKIVLSGAETRVVR